MSSLKNGDTQFKGLGMGLRPQNEIFMLHGVSLQLLQLVNIKSMDRPVLGSYLRGGLNQGEVLKSSFT